MLKLKALSEYADIPGSVLLVLLVFFQIIFVGPSAQGVREEHEMALENAVVSLCSDNLEIKKTIQTLNSYHMATENGFCDNVPFKPAKSGHGYLNFPDALFYFSKVEKWIALSGVFLFLVGLSYRLSAKGQT